MKKINFVQAIFAVAFLIIALSIGYYFVIYIPQKDKNALEQKKLEQSTKNSEVQQNKISLANCLSNAEVSYTAYWNSECKTRGLKDNCSLPIVNLNIIQKNLTDNKNDCFKRYPQ